MIIKQRIQVEGMSCSHCVTAVTKAVEALPGVQNVTVSLEGKYADVKFDDSAVSLDAIDSAIEDQGYDVVR